MADHRARLCALLRELAVQRGNFTLTSGRQSDILVDAKRVALHPEGSRLCGRLLLAAVRERWPEAEAVGGRTLGADPLAVAIAGASFDDGGRPLHAFIVRKEPKKHGSANLLERSGALRDGATVVVLEDTSTTGGSAMAAVEAVRAAGFAVAGVLTLVDREEGAAERFAEAGLDFAAIVRLDELRGPA